MYRKYLKSNLNVLLHELYLLRHTRFQQNRTYFQHGNTTLYRHCVSVAYVSCIIAARLGNHVNIHDLVRGALLHDYFLYDWHKKDDSHRLHGFRHPKKALQNALEDFSLSEKERDIIVHHMFPLTIAPPACREAWIVTLADKWCSTLETLHRFS